MLMVSFAPGFVMFDIRIRGEIHDFYFPRGKRLKSTFTGTGRRVDHARR